MPFRTAAVLVVALGVLAAPAHASEKRWFECPSQTGKVLNTSTAPSGWSATAPTASFTSGAGCGHLTTGSNGQVTVAVTAPANPVARFAGTYTGKFDSVNVELWELAAVPNTNDLSNMDARPVRYELKVDGVVKATGTRVLPWTRWWADRTQRYVLDLHDLDVLDGTHQVTLDVSMGASTSDASALVFGAAEVPAHIEFLEGS